MLYRTSRRAIFKSRDSGKGIFFSFQFAPHIPAAVVTMIAEVSAAITNYEVNLRAEIMVWDVEAKERSLEH